MRAPWRARAWPVLLALLLTALGAAAGAAVSLVGGPSWEASRTLAYTTYSADPLLAGGPPSETYLQRSLQNAATLAQSQEVLEPAADGLGLSGWTELRDAVSVTPESGTDVLQLTATASAAGPAQERLDAVTESLTQVAQQRVVDTASAVATAARRSLEQTPEGSGLQELAARADVIARTARPVQVLSTPPPAQTGPDLLRDVATGAVLGLLLAAGVLVLLRVVSGRVRTGRDAGEVLALPSAEVRSGGLDDQGERLVHDLLRAAAAHPRRRLLVVPAGSSSLAAADELAELVEQHRTCPEVGPDGAGDVVVLVADDPSTSVLSADAQDSSVVALAVAPGVPARDVRTVQRMSERWERPLAAAFVGGS